MAPRFRGKQGDGRGVVSHIEIKLLGENCACGGGGGGRRGCRILFQTLVLK